MNSKIILPLLVSGLMLGLVNPSLSAQNSSSLGELPQNVGAATEDAIEYLDDAMLTAKIKSLFLAEKGLDSMDIGVENNDGVVTLTGMVDTQRQIHVAEQIALKQKGVKSVVNKLTLKRAK